MRKHRLFGVVIAVLLLGTTPFKPRPSSQHLSTSSDSDSLRHAVSSGGSPRRPDRHRIRRGTARAVRRRRRAAAQRRRHRQQPQHRGAVGVARLSAGKDRRRPRAAAGPAGPGPTCGDRGVGEPCSPPPPARRVLAAGTPGVWAALRHCESGGNYADNTGNGYYGAYQFSSGDLARARAQRAAVEAPPAVQDQAAQRLQARSGWGQWPACSRRLRLLIRRRVRPKARDV